MSDNPKPLVLVIDPDPKTATSLLPLLVAEGYRAASCSAIARSLSAVQRRRPDLVLVSKEMENCDGMILIGRIKEMSPDTRVILLIEPGDWPSVLDAIEAGADDLRSKRSGRESVLRSVRRLLAPVFASEAGGSLALRAR
jgi:two-component system response regulator PilR (NtrC family)